MHDQNKDSGKLLRETDAKQTTMILTQNGLQEEAKKYVGSARGLPTVYIRTSFY
jgi:hypothetical protein